MPVGIVPYSPEWWEARRGKITASRMSAAVYGGPAGRNTLLDTLERELSTDFVWPPENDAAPLKWGREQEPKSRALIEMLYDVEVVEPGLLFHADVPIIGATPDYAFTSVGIDMDAYITVGEIKCPWKLKNHVKFLVGGISANQDYVCQVQTQLLVMAAPVAWFTSYHPEAPEGSKLYREIVHPDIPTHNQMLETCFDLAKMLKSGSRYDTGRRVTKNAAGIPQIF